MANQKIEEYLSKIQLLTNFESFPNRTLFNRSKVIDLASISLTLSQSAQLYAQYLYLLFISQKMRKSLQVSSKAFISRQQQIIFFYFFGEQKQLGFTKVENGHFCQEVIRWFRMIFNTKIIDENQVEKQLELIEWGEFIIDLEQNSGKFSKQKLSCKNFLINQEQNGEQKVMFETLNSLNILQKLENLKIYKNYLYNLKVLNSIIISHVLDKKNQLHEIFTEIIKNQKIFNQKLISPSNKEEERLYLNSILAGFQNFLIIANKVGLIQYNPTKQSNTVSEDSSSSLDEEIQKLLSLKKSPKKPKIFNFLCKLYRKDKKKILNTENVKQIEDIPELKSSKLGEFRAIIEKMSCKLSLNVCEDTQTFSIFLKLTLVWPLNIHNYVELNKVWLFIQDKWIKSMAKDQRGIHFLFDPARINLIYGDDSGQFKIQEKIEIEPEYSPLMTLIYCLDHIMMIFFILEPVLEVQFLRETVLEQKNFSLNKVEISAKKLEKMVKIYTAFQIKMQNFTNQKSL